METYLVILHDAIDGTDQGRAELRQKLKSKFHLSEDVLDRMFIDLPIILKRGVSKEKVEKYGKALEAMGAFVEILEEEPLSFDGGKENTSGVESSGMKDYNLALDTTTSMPAVGSKPLEPAHRKLSAKPSDLGSSLSFDAPQHEIPAKADVAPSVLTSFEVAPAAKKSTAPAMTAEKSEVKETPPADLSPPPAEAIEPLAKEKVFRQKDEIESNAEPLDENPQPLVDQGPPPVVEEYRLNRTRVSFAIALLIALIGYALTPKPSSYDETTDSAAQTKLVAKLLEEQRAIRGETKPAVPGQAQLGSVVLRGEKTEGLTTVKSDLAISKGTPTGITLSITSQPPPHRTPKDIIDGVGQTYWLERYEFATKKVDNQAIEENDKQMVHAHYDFLDSGKAYIRENLSGAERNSRVIAKCHIAVDMDFQKNVATVSWQVQFGDDTAVQSLTYPVEHQKNGEFLIHLTGELPLNAQ